MLLLIYIQTNLELGANAFKTQRELLDFINDLLLYKKGIPYFVMTGYKVVAKPEYFLTVYKSQYDVSLLTKWRANYESQTK